LKLVSAKIVLNGKEYDGIDAMPPDVRKDYEAVLESLKTTGGEEVLSLLQRGDRTSIKTTFREIVVNGKTYGSVDEMPVEVRRMYEQAVARMGSAAAAGSAAPRPPRPSRPALRPPPTAEDRGARGGGLRILFWMALGALITLWIMRRGHLF
jgi:hypothetical protein